MPDWIAAGWKEYARRLPPHLPLSLIEVPVAGRSNAGRESRVEAERLLARVPDRARLVALHGAGKVWSTEQLAARLADWQQDGDPVCFVIGGADGLDPELLDRSQARWSFGPAVFPHMLIRVMVAEQLYRAWTILSGHPYHRA
ncbi:MAG: 23S rRNA (pseudouridine(1915)-N(3))-methyltransferase RlmH [Wenzhouxiangella sp.]|nr:MAG: 23S rRNA (pseudouridine(1915)-N(3))-methyltransferase RlmH [Wenzhouxiangella sp.]